MQAHVINVISPSKVLQESIAENQEASRASLHRLVRKSLEHREKQKKPIAVKSMRDLKEAAAIVEPKDTHGGTQVTIPVQINIG